jgi:hypothetical protein
MSIEPVGGLRGQFGGWDPTDAVKAADRALARLRELGVHVPRENRLAAARDLVKRAESLNVQLGPSDWEMEFALAEANKTIFEQHVIVSALHDVDKPAKKKLKIMLRGDATPKLTGDDHPRDEQAELYTGALLGAAGYGVKIGEPDLLLTRGAARFGVAVKRVKSESQYQSRILEAERQIEKQDLDGIIVINAEVHLMRLYHADRSVDYSKALFGKTDQLISYLDLEKPGSRILAVIGVATSFRRPVRRGGREFEVNMHFHPQFVITDDPAAKIEAGKVAERMARGIQSKVTQSMKLD